MGWPATKSKDLDGQSLLLDSDADSHFTADTDDRLDLALAGTDLFRWDGTVTTPVNGLDWIASATGGAVQAKATGTDTNISIDLVPKGTGKILNNGQVISAGLRRAGLAIFQAQTSRAVGMDIAGNLPLIPQVFS